MAEPKWWWRKSWLVVAGALVVVAAVVDVVGGIVVVVAGTVVTEVVPAIEVVTAGASVVVVLVPVSASSLQKARNRIRSSSRCQDDDPPLPPPRGGNFLDRLGIDRLLDRLVDGRLVHRFHDEGRVIGWRRRGRRDQFGRAHRGGHRLPERCRVPWSEVERLVASLDQEDVALLGTRDDGLREAGDLSLIHREDHFVADLGEHRLGPRVVQLLASGPDLTLEVPALAGHVTAT